MRAAFTPGPWEVGDQSRGYAEIDAYDAPIPWRGLAKVVVKMEAVVGLKDYPQGQANARLIAAAPELYEALDKAVRQYDAIKGGPIIGSLEAARAVLAKARGEA